MATDLEKLIAQMQPNLGQPVPTPGFVPQTPQAQVGPTLANEAQLPQVPQQPQLTPGNVNLVPSTLGPTFGQTAPQVQEAPRRGFFETLGGALAGPGAVTAAQSGGPQSVINPRERQAQDPFTPFQPFSETAQPAVDSNLPPMLSQEVDPNQQLPSGSLGTVPFDPTAPVPQVSQGDIAGAQGPLESSIQPQQASQFQSPTSQGLTTAGGQPLAEFLAGGQQLDPQGRMIDPNVDRTAFEQESLARDQRQEAMLQDRAQSRQDQRGGASEGAISQSDQADIAKGQVAGASAGDKARAATVAARNGVDLNGQPLKSADSGITRSEALAERKFQHTQNVDAYNAGQDALVAQGKSQAAFEQDEALLRQVSGDAGRIGRLTNEAIGLTTESGTTALSGSLLKNIPGTDANQLKEVLSVVTSKVALDRLMEIKKTGATLGQVSEKELELLQNSYDALKQGLSPERLRKALTAYATNLKAVEDKTSKAFIAKHGQEKFDAIMGGGSGGGTSGAIKNDQNVAGASDALLSSGKY